MSGGLAMPRSTFNRHRDAILDMLGIIIECDKEDGYTDFELTLRPTADFLTPLLSRGAAIKVLSPEWLAHAVKELHLEAARRYE